MSLTLDRQNAYRASYAAAHPGWQPATARYEALVRCYLQRGDRLLDLGCGRGGVLEQLGPAAARAVGLDPDLPSLAEHRLPRLPRAVAAASALPIASGSLDAVICSWVLEHLPDPLATFREVARVLRPGGAFVFLTPGGASPAALLNRALRPVQARLVPLLYGRTERDTFPVLYRANSPRQIIQAAAGAGLALEHLERIEDPTYFAFHPLLYRLNAALAGLLPASMAEHIVGACVKPG